MDRLQAIETYWSDQARTFDDEPDHGLADPHIRAAWAGRLAEWVPPGPLGVADLGRGTGSLSVLLAASGAEVVGVDLSLAMIERADRKARVAGLAVEFRVGDASHPDLPDGFFDVVLSRHLLWTLTDLVAALSRWARLLNPQKGRLVLIEGRWFDPSRSSTNEYRLPWDGGVAATQLVAALQKAHKSNAKARPASRASRRCLMETPRAAQYPDPRSSASVLGVHYYRGEGPISHPASASTV